MSNSKKMEHLENQIIDLEEHVAFLKKIVESQSAIIKTLVDTRESLSKPLVILPPSPSPSPSCPEVIDNKEVIETAEQEKNTTDKTILISGTSIRRRMTIV